MRFFLLIAGIFITSKIDLLAAEAGMPQLDPTYWASQAFWLILIFTALYLALSNLFIPKIKDNIDNRENKIKDDLDEAQKLKNLAEQKLREYELNENPSKQFSKVRQNLKRVQVQAIDMDWLFEKNNAEDLIEIISKCQSTDALTKKPIKLFVNMMWTRF